MMIKQLSTAVALLCVSLNLYGHIYDVIETDYGHFYGSRAGLFSLSDEQLYIDQAGRSVKTSVFSFYYDKKGHQLLFTTLSQGILTLDFKSNTIRQWSELEQVEHLIKFKGIFYAATRENFYQLSAKGAVVKSYLDDHVNAERSLIPVPFITHEGLMLLTAWGYYQLSPNNGIVEKKGTDVYAFVASIENATIFMGNNVEIVSPHKNTTMKLSMPVKKALKEDGSTHTFFTLDVGGNLSRLKITDDKLEVERLVPAKKYGSIGNITQLSSSELLLSTQTGIQYYSTALATNSLDTLGVVNSVSTTHHGKPFLYRQNEGIYTGLKAPQLMIAHNDKAEPVDMAIVDNTIYVGTDSGVLVFDKLTRRFKSTLLNNTYIRRLKVVNDTIYIADGYGYLWRLENESLIKVLRVADDYMELGITDFEHVNDSWLLTTTRGYFRYQNNTLLPLGLSDTLLYRIIKRENDILLLPFLGGKIFQLQRSNPGKMMGTYSTLSSYNQSLHLDSALVTPDQRLWVAADNHVYVLDASLTRKRLLCSNCYSTHASLSLSDDQVNIMADNRTIAVAWRNIHIADDKPLAVIPMTGQLNASSWTISPVDSQIQSLRLMNSDNIWYAINDGMLQKASSILTISDSKIESGDIIRFFRNQSNRNILVKSITVDKLQEPLTLDIYQYLLVAMLLLMLIREVYRARQLHLTRRNWIKEENTLKEKQMRETLTYRQHELNAKQGQHKQLLLVKHHIDSIKKHCRDLPSLLQTDNRKNVTTVTLHDGESSRDISFSTMTQTILEKINNDITIVKQAVTSLFQSSDLDMLPDSQFDLRSLLHTKEALWHSLYPDVKLHTHIDDNISQRSLFSITAWGMRELIFRFVELSTQFSSISDVHVYLSSEKGSILFSIEDYCSPGNHNHERVDIKRLGSSMSELARRHGGELVGEPHKNNHNGYSCRFRFQNMITFEQGIERTEIQP